MKASVFVAALLAILVTSGMPLKSEASTETTLFHLVKAYSDKHNVDFIVKPDMQRDVQIAADDVSEVDRSMLIKALKSNGLALQQSVDGVLKIGRAADASEDWERLLK